jgi:hypothetical protein
VNDREAVYVLAVCSSYDGRKPSTVDAQTWAYELREVERDAAVEAVREFYRLHPDDRIRPGHVTQILADQRKSGLAKSSRIENAAIEALDPDDPDFDRKYMEAVQGARRAAGENPAVIPNRVAIGGPGRGTDDVAERARRGNERVRQALAEAKPFRQGGTEGPAIPENLKKAREAAVDYRAGQKRRDNALKLGAAGGQVLSQINQIRGRRDH